MLCALNKSALRQGGMTQEDELRWFAERMGFQGVCGELNVLQSLWTARVTSHVPLKSVSSLLSAEKVAEAIGMVSRALRASGVTQPRIGVCGLNPHNGDHGNYGDEEQRIIEPGIRMAAACRGMLRRGHSLQTRPLCVPFVPRAVTTRWSPCTMIRARSP